MNDDHLELLRRIAKDVAEIKAALSASAVSVASAFGVQTGGGSGGAAGGAATAAELDAQYGDPEIRRDPGRWSGESFVGCRFSQTSPDYLDCLADFKEWQAGKDEASGAKDNKGRPKAGWSRKDARLARGWAARLRSGWKPKSGPSNGVPGGGKPVTDEDYDAGGFGDDEVPF